MICSNNLVIPCAYDDFRSPIAKAMARQPDSPASSSAATRSSPFRAPQRQLTRARKLRHLQEHEVSDLDFDLIKSPPRDGRARVNVSASTVKPSVDINNSASTVKPSVDINNSASNQARFAAAVPQPLPLPDLQALLSSDRNKEPSDAFRLPSPEQAKEADRGRARGKERERRRENSSEVAGHDAFYGPSPNLSGIVHRDARINGDPQRNVDHVETWLCRNMPQNVIGVDRAHEGLGIQVQFRSAPATAYSSPMLSPRRMGAEDLISSYNMAHQVWSSPEMLSKDMTSGLPCAALQEKGIFGRDCSPIISPGVTSPLRTRNTSQNTSRATSPVRPKLFVDTFNMHLDNNGALNGHRLPLPPTAAALSPSNPVPKISALSSLLSQTSAQSSPSPQIPAQSSPQPQFSGHSSPQITPRPELLPQSNKWSKGKLIGRGTFGSVYAATNRETGALCAMKEVELCPDDSKSIESMKQLEQEIKVLSHLKHPNIVQYYGSEIVDDRFYIYLEYVYPGSINKYVREHCGAMTESVVRNFTRHILSGLAYLHGTKTIHRDIKGANLLVDASGVVKLADFGMAKHLTGQAADLSLKGSPYWMAPELMQAVMKKDNSSNLVFAVDIWSLGCTVIEMFTGKPPWSEYEGAAAMFKVMRETPPIPEALSADGKDFLQCCFQRNPAERPSARVLLEHPFVKNSQHLDASYYPSASNGSHIMDKTHSAREVPTHKLDQMPTSPTTRTTGKLVPSNETSQQSHPETSDLTAVPRLSPRSTLQNLPGLSPPRIDNFKLRR